jgi:hypothetical protein
MQIKQSGRVTTYKIWVGLHLVAMLAACGGDDDDSKQQGVTAGQGGGTAVLSLPARTAGKACAQDADCVNGSCAHQVLNGTALLGATSADAPGGYCTAGCLTNAECGEGGACLGAGQATGAAGGGTSRGLCYASCPATDSCREGYRCISSFGAPISAPNGVNGSCRPAPVTDKLPDSVVGSMCSVDDDCSGGSCMLTDMFSANMSGYPGGYCTGRCLEDADCGVAGVCSPALLGGAGTCYRKCEDDSDCDREGYRCRTPAGANLMPNQSAPKQCAPGVKPLSDGIVGRACSADGECGGAAMSCRTQLAGAFGGRATPLPGGYCTQGCVDASDCGAGGVCTGALGGFVNGTCYKSCGSATDCREGYSCRAPAGGGAQGGNAQTVCAPTPPPMEPAPDQDAGAP